MAKKRAAEPSCTEQDGQMVLRVHDATALTTTPYLQEIYSNAPVVNISVL
jgi:hypothetical protein